MYIVNETADGLGYHRGGSTGCDGDDFGPCQGVVPFKTRRETIEIKHGDPVEIEVRTVAGVGPVISDNGLLEAGGALAPLGGLSGGSTLALRWVSIDESVVDTTMDAFLDINSADDYTSFRAALEKYVAPAQNFIFADGKTGDVGYQIPGLIPKRLAGHTGMVPAPLSYAWQGWIPYDRLPRVLNPASGFIASANNRATPDCFPTHITCDWDAGSTGLRAKRITDMIETTTGGAAGGANGTGTQHTVASMRAIQTDYKSYTFDMFFGILQNACSRAAAATEAGAGAGAGAGGIGSACEQLLHAPSGWNGTMSVGSKEATLFARWFVEVSRFASNDTGTDYWKDVVYLHRQLAAECTPAPAAPHATTGAAGGCSFSLAALERAAAFPAANWGEGSIHPATFMHQVLDASIAKCVGDRSTPHGGDEHTINVGHFDFSDPNMPQTAGPSYRQVVDLGNVEASLFVNPLGQNGNQLQANYDNLLQLWSDGEYMPMQTVGFPVDERIELLPAATPDGA